MFRIPAGVIVNSISIFFGGLIGSLIGGRIPSHFKQSMPTAFGFVAMVMGIVKVASTQSLLVVTLSILFGTLIGEWAQLDKRIRTWAGARIKRFSSDNSTEALELFMIACVIFCASGTGIFGAMEERFTGDASILLSKSALDFFSAILFASTVGFSIALLSIPQVIIMLLLFFTAGLVSPWLSEAVKLNFMAVGGVITMMSGFSMANLSSIKPINSIPSLVVVMLISCFL